MVSEHPTSNSASRKIVITRCPTSSRSSPGDSSCAPGASNKREHEQWLERFVELGLQIYPDEVILKGFPWRQTICVRGHIHLDDPNDGRVYDNRYVLWGRIAWGKLREYETYEDTQESKRLDAYLAQR